MFQHYALFRHMTVADNIAFGLRVRPRASAPGRRRDPPPRRASCSTSCSSPGWTSAIPAQLSGGQRQRVALARALAVEPRVLLLDEPFGALDAKVRKDLRRWLREIHDRTGHTTVFVTHDQDEALELADRVAILNHGRIEQVGSPDEIHDRPASPFVTAFVGETASIPIIVSGGRALLDGRDIGIAAQGCAEGPAALYLRPVDLGIGDGVIGEGTARLSGRIVALRRTGAGRRAEVAVNEKGDIIELDLPVTTPVAPGDIIPIRIGRCWVFPEGA